MVVEHELNVSAEAFFCEITKSIIGDVKRQTGKNIRVSQLKPKMNYKKKIPGRSSSNAEVVVKILECELNRVYSSSFTSKIDETIVKYEIEQIDDNKIKVTYTETYHILQKHHGHFGEGRYFEKKSVKRAKKLLKQIEETILQSNLGE